MRYFILIFFLFIALPVSAQNLASTQAAQPARTLVRDIRMEGFVLEENRDQFIKLFKPYRNKPLSTDDINAILQQLQEIYEQAGYQGLVSIDPHVKNKRLIFTVSLIR